MTIVDANVLLYAVNAASPQHATAKAWLDDALSGDTRVGLPWLSLLAFLRIATHRSVFPRPLTVVQALDVIDVWCGAPNVVHPEPGRGFAARFAHTLTSGVSAWQPRQRRLPRGAGDRARCRRCHLRPRLRTLPGGHDRGTWSASARRTMSEVGSTVRSAASLTSFASLQGLKAPTRSAPQHQPPPPRPSPDRRPATVQQGCRRSYRCAAPDAAPAAHDRPPGR